MATVYHPPKVLPVGELIIEAEIARWMLEGRLDPFPWLRRHLADDWGELTDQERRGNAYAIVHGGEIFSSYRTDTGRTLWIVSEWDRRVTTLMLSSES